MVDLLNVSDSPTKKIEEAAISDFHPESVLAVISCCCMLSTVQLPCRSDCEILLQENNDKLKRNMTILFISKRLLSVVSRVSDAIR